MVTRALFRIAVLSLWASLCSNTALAAPCDKGGAQAQGRPRIGLVLGGGGAGGAAAWEASSSGPAVHCSGTPRATRRRCSGAAASTEQLVCGRCFQTLVSCHRRWPRRPHPYQRRRRSRRWQRPRPHRGQRRLRGVALSVAKTPRERLGLAAAYLDRSRIAEPPRRDTRTGPSPSARGSGASWDKSSGPPEPKRRQS